MSSGLRDLKNLGLTLQTELESQDDLIDDVDHRVQRNKLKQDRLNKQMNQLLKKKWSSKVIQLKLKKIYPLLTRKLPSCSSTHFGVPSFSLLLYRKKNKPCNYSHVIMLKIKKKWINMVQFCAFANVGVCPIKSLSKKWMTLLTMILYQGIGSHRGRIFKSFKNLKG